jgi:hypothetical protein
MLSFSVSSSSKKLVDEARSEEEERKFVTA